MTEKSLQVTAGLIFLPLFGISASAYCKEDDPCNCDDGDYDIGCVGEEDAGGDDSIKFVYISCFYISSIYSTMIIITKYDWTIGSSDTERHCIYCRCFTTCCYCRTGRG